MPSCVLIHCKAYRNKKEAGVSFFKFPNVCRPERELWIKFVQEERREPEWLPSSASTLCSKHFRVEDVQVGKSGRKMPKKNAVPFFEVCPSQKPSPVTPINLHVLDTESIFDTPRIIHLKKTLRKNNTETPMVIQRQYDDEDVVTAQQLSVRPSRVPENSAPAVHSVHIKQENDFLMKPEVEAYYEVPIKQEMDVEPTVLQPRYMPHPSSSLCQPGTSREPVTNLDSSRKRREKIKNFTEREIHMVMNVYKYVQSSWPKDEFPYETRLQEKTASILGISVSSVCNIVREYSHNKIDKDPLATEKRPEYSEKIDDFDKNAIKRKILSFYMNGELPRMQKVFQVINEDERLPDLKWTSFRNIVKRLKFKCIKLHQDRALIDGADVAISRRNYLKKMKEYRKQNRRIFYAGQTWIDTGHTVPMDIMGIKSKSQSFMESSTTGALDSHSRGARLTVFHMGNESGFVDAADDIFESTPKGHDHHLSSNAEHFEKCFERNLPKLGQNAVVVMENAPYNSRLQEKIPTAAWKKVHIQDWLRSKDIRFDEEEVTTELLSKVKEAKTKFETYAVDELAKKYNVEVLRLPPYHYELNPLELVWVDVKQYVATNSASLELEDMEDLIRKALRNVTAEKWRDCVQHALKEEDDFYSKIDEMIDKTIDSFDFNRIDSEYTCSDLDSDDSYSSRSEESS